MCAYHTILMRHPNVTPIHAIVAMKPQSQTLIYRKHVINRYISDARKKVSQTGIIPIRLVADFGLEGFWAEVEEGRLSARSWDFLRAPAVFDFAFAPVL